MTLNPIHDQQQFLVACEQNSPAYTGLYRELVNEEWNNETRAACNAGDAIAVFDGLLDTVYVLAGLANTCRTANDDTSFQLRELPEEIPVCWGTAIYEVQMAVAPAPDGSVRVAQVIRAAEIVWSLGLKLGFPMDAGWLEVHASNMAKVDADTGKVIRRDDGKILKPEGWVGPDLQAVLEGKSGNYADKVAEVQHG